MSGEPDPTGGDRSLPATREPESASTTAFRPAADESTIGIASAPNESSETAFPDLHEGQTLADRFFVRRYIARGATGAVYEATDTMLQSPVAIKVLRAQVAPDTTAMERFRREVLLARRVSHPNVCRVYELYQAHSATGLPLQFLSMELLQGETLAARIRREGRLTTADALPLVAQMCEGLGAAHAEGIIHRDFKSSNVLLVVRHESSGVTATRSTRVVITDFGIARAMEVERSGKAAAELTGGTGLVGTPAYMAPEQVTGGAVTPATDLYALGVVMYEMVSGRLPFPGDTPLASAMRRINEPPPHARAVVPDLEAKWARTIDRCLARDPGQRFGNASDVIAALAPATARQRRLAELGRTTLLGALVVLLAIMVLGHRIGWFGPLKQTDRERSASTANPGHRNLLIQPRKLVAVVGISPQEGTTEPWMGPGFSQLIEDELAEADEDVRIVPWARVAMAKASMGISPDREPGPEERRRLFELLSADAFVLGTSKCMESAGGPKCEARVKLLVSSDDHGSTWSERFTPSDIREIRGAAGRIGEELRRSLGATLSPEQHESLIGRAPRQTEVLRFHADGLVAFAHFDSGLALNKFEAAVALDPSYFDAQIARTFLLQQLGLFARARVGAEAASKAAERLSTRRRMEAEARSVWLQAPVEQAVASYQSLLSVSPDDVDLALETALRLPPESAVALLERVRQIPGRAALDLRLPLLEAGMQFRIQRGPRVDSLLRETDAVAQRLGASRELSASMELRGESFFQAGDSKQSLEQLQKAASLSAEAGDLRRQALIIARQAVDQRFFDVGREREMRREAAALLRRIGDRMSLHLVLLGNAHSERRGGGSIPAARAWIAEANAELRAGGEPPTAYSWLTAGWVDLAAGDPNAAWKNYFEARASQPKRLFATTFDLYSNEDSDDPWIFKNQYLANLEWRLLEAGDRIVEARAVALTAQGQAKMVANSELQTAFEGVNCILECDAGKALQGARCLQKNRWFVETRAFCYFEAGEWTLAAEAASELLRREPEHEMGRALLAGIDVMKGGANGGATLKSLSEDLRRRGLIYRALQVDLLLGTAEVWRKPPEGTRRLRALEEEARGRSLFLLARKAREVLERKHPLAGSQR